MAEREAEIYAALMAHARLMSSTGPMITVAEPEPATPFEPPVNEYGEAAPYILVDALPNRPRWEGVGEGRIEQGVFPMLLVWPKHSGGDQAAYEIGGKVRHHFAKLTRLTSGATKIMLDRETWIAGPLRDEAESRFPITAYWVTVP